MPYLQCFNEYYEAVMDPLSDAFDPQKDLEDTRFWKDRFAR